MSNVLSPLAELENPTEFIGRHIGPDAQQTQAMLKALGKNSLEELISATVPTQIRFEATSTLKAPITEQAALAELKALANKNQVLKSYILS